MTLRFFYKLFPNFHSYRLMKTFTLIFLSLSLSISGQSQSYKNLQKSINNILEFSELRGSIVGIAAKESSNDLLYAHNNELLMIPGSTLKVITTFVALDLLDSDFRYVTKVLYNGSIDRSGTLTGNIWIVGAGDPSLGSPRETIGRNFQALQNEILQALKINKIKCVDGKIIIQDDRFDQEMVHPNWPYSDVGNYYGGGVSGLNINENEYTIHFNTRKAIGKKADLKFVYPEVPFLKLNNEVRIADKESGDNAYIFGGPGNYMKIIRGTLPQGYLNYEIKGAIPNPSEFFGYHLSSFLEKNGISNIGYEINLIDKNVKTNLLIEFKSKALTELVKLSNEKSINLYCEAFLKSISSGTREHGIKEINNRLNKYKLDTFSILMEDGSGLSPRNSITPGLFVEFLDHYKNKWGIEICKELLPQVSNEGTVRGMLKNSPAAGKAFLKSGYIGKVLCYAGYLQSKSGKWISLALMFNQYRCETSEVRSIAEKIIEEIYLSS